jgi:hypothetical protein
VIDDIVEDKAFAAALYCDGLAALHAEQVAFEISFSKVHAVHFHDVADNATDEEEDDNEVGFGFAVPQTVQFVALFGFFIVQAGHVHSDDEDVLVVVVLFLPSCHSSVNFFCLDLCGFGLPQTVQADTDFGFSTVHLSHVHIFASDDDLTVPVKTGSCIVPLLLVLLALKFG